MGAMIAFIRNLFYNIYKVGEFEASKKRNAARLKELSANISASASADVTIGKFYNNQNKATKIVIGQKSVIQGELLVFKHGGEIIVGDHCFIGPGSRIWSSKKIIIGNRVLISHNVNIHDNDSHPIDHRLRHEDFIHIFSKGLQENVDLEEKEIIIEDDAWIGFNAIILKGVRIGKAAIIGAGAIVTKDVPAFTVVVSEGQKIIRSLEN